MILQQAQEAEKSQNLEVPGIGTGAPNGAAGGRRWVIDTGMK